MMAATAFDSFYLRDRHGTAEMRAIWDDHATIQRWLDVEAALALTEAELGLVPRPAARAIARAARVERLDLRAMRREFDRTWNPVVPLVNALRARLPASAARYVHWGATSRNIIDTALALQIRASHDVLLRELGAVGDALAKLARRHRDTLMAGRTHGQQALPVTFGWRCAVWLDELMRQRERLAASRARVLTGQFGGAVGTLAALGPSGLRVERRLMQRLGLGVPRVPVKTAGDRFAEFFLLVAMLSATLGKIAQNLYNLQQSEVDEVSESPRGKVGSSAMPHKLNPVASGSVVLLGRLLRARAPLMLDYVHAEGEDDHRQGETGWAFPQEVCLLASAQLAISRKLLAGLVVKPRHMLRNLERAGGVVVSEAVMMALAPRMGRDHAHALVLRLHRASLESGVPFREAVRGDPEVRARLRPRQLDAALDYRRSLGLAGRFVDQVLRDWARAGRTRRGSR
jgi:3-carboxy-cis,cis-muconate cycloisomerase